MNDNSDLEEQWIINVTALVMLIGLGFAAFLLVLLARFLWGLVG